MVNPKNVFWHGLSYSNKWQINMTGTVENHSPLDASFNKT